MTFTLPTTFYLVATDFAEVGIGNAGDVTGSLDVAYDQFVAALDDQQPARIFRIDLDVETNAPEAISDVTDKAISELAQICAERGLDMPEAA